MVYENNSCTIYDKQREQNVVVIPMTPNRMFPLNVSHYVSNLLVVKGDHDTRLWHLRYGHLNVQSLRVLS